MRISRLWILLMMPCLYTVNVFAPNTCVPKWGWNPAPSLGSITVSPDPIPNGCIGSAIIIGVSWGSDTSGTCMDSVCANPSEFGNLTLSYTWQVTLTDTSTVVAQGSTPVSVISFTPTAAGLYRLNLDKSGSSTTPDCGTSTLGPTYLTRWFRVFDCGPKCWNPYISNLTLWECYHEVWQDDPQTCLTTKKLQTVDQADSCQRDDSRTGTPNCNVQRLPFGTHGNQWEYVEPCPGGTIHYTPVITFYYGCGTACSGDTWSKACETDPASTSPTGGPYPRQPGYQRGCP
jgi:hypothetical protein